MEKFEELAAKVRREAEALAAMEAMEAEIDVRRLRAAVAAAVPALRFERLCVEFREHNCNGNCSHPDEYTRGDVSVVHLYDSDDRGSRGSLSDGDRIDVDQVYLVRRTAESEPSFASYTKSGHRSNWQNAWSGWTRVLDRELAVQEVDADAAIAGLERALTSRLASVQKRRTVVERRLQEVRALQI